jgi:hypothetical protein
MVPSMTPGPVLAGDVGSALALVRRAIVAADVVHCDDVGMREGGNGARFQLESAEAIGISRRCAGQDLERHIPPRRGSRARSS